MAVSFKKFAFTTMSWLANSLWFLVSTFLIRLLCALFPRVCDQRSQIIGGGEVGDESGNQLDCVGVSSAITSKCEFLGGNSFCGYIQDPQITSFKVQELFVNSVFEDGNTEDSVFTDPCVETVDSGGETPPSGDDFRVVDDQVRIESPVANESSLEDEVEKGVCMCDEPSLDEPFDEEGVMSSTVDDQLRISDESSLEDEVQKGVFMCDEPSLDEPLDEEGVMSSTVDNPDESPWENQLVFSFNNVRQEPTVLLANDFWHTNGKFIADFDEFYGHQSTTKEEAMAPETPACLDTKSVDPYEDDVSGSESAESGDNDHQGLVMDPGKAEEKSDHVLDEDDEMDIDVLMEHQSYVQKMKKEMKHLMRTNGLPTILEDSESPRMDEDLKPLKIDERVGYKDRLDEIQRFYKTYLEKMKRLDILCHQTMYSIGFLQLKNQDQLTANKKLSVSLPSIKSLLAHNLLPNKFRRHESDPLQKLIRDLHRDLELVYVGQLCLSWEILKWEHTKAEDLQLFDTMGLRHYTLVAGEFQQFRVLVQRFSEDEPFQGPRVETYVKTRCANSNLLQVPPIKEDVKNAEDGQAVVSIVRLTDIIEESMHAFWEFIRADKKEAGNVGVRDPLDAELLSDIRTNLAKKERRIKDLVRSGNCIVKKFQKQQECRLTHELLLALVELKLVGRVIGMSRLTADQLMWCHKKISKIRIVGRKVHIESSFSLFPC